MPSYNQGSRTKKLTDYISSHFFNYDYLDKLVNLVERYSVVGFRQGNNLWVIHPSAKKKLHWQATHYDIQKNSMLGDCLYTEIKGVLSESGLDFNEQIIFMEATEVESFILNSSSKLYGTS
ncbi:MAG: hypothetical protein ACJAUP_002120 [Cellvibrionaceae bacterium]|jgi:hypothetical protein